MPKHALSDDFEYKGLWWLPESPEHKVAGTVSFDGERITLELLGLIREDAGSWDDKARYPDFILGKAEGKMITLYFTAEMHSTLPWDYADPEVESGTLHTSSFSARYAFIGTHVESPDQLRFKAVSARFTYLEEWLGRDKVPFENTPEKDWGHSAKYSPLEPITTEVPAIESTIAIGATFARRGEMFRSMIWEHNAVVMVRPEQVRDFDWYETMLDNLQKLLTLFVGRPVHVVSVTVHMPGEFTDVRHGELQVPVDLVSVPYSRALREDVPPPVWHWNWRDLLVPFDAVEMQLKTILNEWFEKAELLRPIHELFFSTLYNRRLYGEAKFLNLVQSLESLHARTAWKDKYVPDEEYAAYQDEMLSGLPNDIREILEPRLPYLNRFTLKTRLDGLFKRITPLVRGYIADEPKKFARRVVDTRNYLTHYDENQKKRAMTHVEILETNPKLQLWLIALLLREAGADLRVVADAVDKFAEKNYVEYLRRYASLPDLDAARTVRAIESESTFVNSPPNEAQARE